MDGSRSPVSGQQGSMDVDATESGQIQQAFGQELPKSRHHNELGLELFHFFLESRGLHPFRLEHWQTLGQGIFLHDFILIGFHQGLQAGRSKFRSSHKYDFHAFSSFGLAERLMALSMNRIPSR